MTIKQLETLYGETNVFVNTFGNCEKPSFATIKRAKREGRLIADATNGYIKTVSNNPHESYALMVK